MAHPGLTLAVLVGVAIGTAIYYYFNQDNDQQQRQNQYSYDGNYDNDYDSDYNSWTPSNSIQSSSSSQRRRRRNSSSMCSICQDNINRATLKKIPVCGHEFHDHCITMWFRQNRICPNCRQIVNP